MRTSVALLVALPVTLVLVACSAPVDDAGAGEGEGEGDNGPTYEDIDGSFVIDVDDRPVTFKVPDDYDPARAYTLMLVLAGYGITGAQFEAAIGFDSFADDAELVFAFPEGRVDGAGYPFWNASDACCDFEGTGVDDAAFLVSALAAARERAHIAKAFVIGHSNGGFMAQRLACDHADAVDGIVSVAGARPNDCSPSRPVAMLQSHGTDDATILYDGGNVGGGMADYPGAADTAAAWSEANGCAGAVDDPAIDLDAAIAGDETRVHRFTGCAAPTALWTTEGGGHVPNGVADYFAFLLAFLESTAE